MRLDRWLDGTVQSAGSMSRGPHPEIHRKRGLVRSQRIEDGPSRPCAPGDAVQLCDAPPEPLPYLAAGRRMRWMMLATKTAHTDPCPNMAGRADRMQPRPGNAATTLVNGLLHHCPDLPCRR